MRTKSGVLRVLLWLGERLWSVSWPGLHILLERLESPRRACWFRDSSTMKRLAEQRTAGPSLTSFLGQALSKQGHVAKHILLCLCCIAQLRWTGQSIIFYPRKRFNCRKVCLISLDSMTDLKLLSRLCSTSHILTILHWWLIMIKIFTYLWNALVASASCFTLTVHLTNEK